MNTLGPTSNSYISQRLKLHYADWGNADAPPLILLHGGQDHCRSWDWAARELQDDWHIIAPDLRGHGDSDWSPDGSYSLTHYVYDLAQLIHQLKLAPVNIVAHSMGGNISLRYAGLYPENVRRIVAIEGLGPSPEMLKKRMEKTDAERIREWIDEKRAASGRLPKRYETLEAAYQRMQEANKFLSEEQARHLTAHGARMNEDGTWSWKFDNYLRIWPPIDVPQASLHSLWGAITCPTLLMYGEDSWASNPVKDGRIQHFNNAECISYENAGHWVHHDRFDTFMTDVKAFITKDA